MSLKPVSGKIESQELNDNFSYLDSAIRTGGGIQLEAFDTLEDLETAYPNGKEGAFIVKNTGDWYYWGGSNWESGGTFIQSEFADVLTGPDEEWVI